MSSENVRLTQDGVDSKVQSNPMHHAFVAIVRPAKVGCACCCSLGCCTLIALATLAPWTLIAGAHAALAVHRKTLPTNPLACDPSIVGLNSPHHFSSKMSGIECYPQIDMQRGLEHIEKYKKTLKALPPLPKVLHVTWMGKFDFMNSTNLMIIAGIQRFQRLNPDWRVEITDDREMDAFLAHHLNASDYNALAGSPPAEKADLWRLLIICHRGGLYADIDRLMNQRVTPLLTHVKLVLPLWGGFTDKDYLHKHVHDSTDARRRNSDPLSEGYRGGTNGLSQDMFGASPGNPAFCEAARANVRARAWCASPLSWFASNHERTGLELMLQLSRHALFPSSRPQSYLSSLNELLTNLGDCSVLGLGPGNLQRSIAQTLFGEPISEWLHQSRLILAGLRQLSPHVASYADRPDYDTWLYRGLDGGDTAIDYPRVLEPGAPTFGLGKDALQEEFGSPHWTKQGLTERVLAWWQPLAMLVPPHRDSAEKASRSGQRRAIPTPPA